MADLMFRDTSKQVLGPDGVPITSAAIAQLREEISATTAIAGRPPFSGHLAYGMDPSRLGAILRAADNGSTLDWMILCEEIEELYPHYQAVLSKRKRQVSQLPIKVVPAESHGEGQRHADFVEAWLETDVLQDALFDILDGVGKGFSTHEIMWETQPGCIRPCELLYRPQRFFEIDWQDGTTMLLRTGAGFAALAPHKFLQHRHRSKSGLVVRSGLTRVVAFMWMFHAYTLKDWALFVQSYGLPIRMGRYGPEASETDKRVLWRAVSSIAGDVAAILPRTTEIEFVKDTDRKAGAELYEKRADWMNREVSKVVLGSTAGTDAIHGSHAVGTEHRAAEQDVEKFDARLLSVTVTRQLVKLMVAFTFGPQEAYPRIQIGQEETAPLKDVIAAVADLGPIGLKVKAADIRDRLDLDDPEDGDETIGGVAPAPEPKITIPSMAVTPPANADAQAVRPGFLGDLLALHAETPPELVEALTQRLAEDAAGALAGLTDAVRAQFHAAHDYDDLAGRLQGLHLPPREFGEAMARGAALANLVGQASMIAELGRR